MSVLGITCARAVRRCPWIPAAVIFIHLSFFPVHTEPAVHPSDFESGIRPILKQYCFGCHSTQKHKGDFDMERFATLSEVKRQPKIWQNVAEHLADDEMPPKEKPQPTPVEKERIQDWIASVLDAIAQEHSGDPGPVVLRRLSNAEYTYTIQDLTGIQSLQPAREFPIDGAAGEGFMNTGQALVMSPSLITKYLDAAKEIAGHALLLPDGFRFSVKTTRRDWIAEILGQIRDFYREFTDPHGGEKVNLQGIVFETNEGGRLPLEKYLAAAIEEREAIQSGLKTAEAAAGARGLNARYLSGLYAMLSDHHPSILLDHVRERWSKATLKEVSELVAEVEQWQKALWKFNSVGHIGKLGGPKAWMESVNPLVSKQEFRVKIPAVSNQKEVTLYFVASDAGDGNAGDYVIWEKPRLSSPGRTNLLLRDLPGLNPDLFGHSPTGRAIDSSSLCVHAPSVIEVRLPADVAAGAELMTTAQLDPVDGAEGSVQLQVLFSKPAVESGLLPPPVAETRANGAWTSNNQRLSHRIPIVVNEGSPAAQRFSAAFDEFRQWFPAALCYYKIVPVDEVITLTLFYREDNQLSRLMLDDSQKAKLDRLWDELRYVSQDALTMVDAFEQLWQYATQDADPKVFEPLRQPIRDRAAAFRQRLASTQPFHLKAVLDFAGRAYRRPLTDGEESELQALYSKLRSQEVPHDDAIRLTLARVLVAPAFLYRAETPAPGLTQAPVNDAELASRLSYFLWSSMPDNELAQIAAAGKLHDTETLLRQTRRMLQDKRVRRLAVEFGCQWLHVHDFESFDEKSERHFPAFNRLRGAMYEETIRFFTDLFQQNRRVLDILDADYVFVNEPLAKHYGIPGVTGPEWQRVEGAKQFSRGGILSMGSILAKESGASRTSPILRGNWVAEVLLGDKLPRPPKDVPRLPEDESTETLTLRQLTEKHSTDPRCYGCHKRIDAFGFALENFDAIGRHRDHDLANRPIHAKAKVLDGTELDGVAGLRAYLLTKRHDAFERQFCRKLLGYALGRAVQLSDEPLLSDMRAQLQSTDLPISPLIESIVRSRQFREIRGRDTPADELTLNSP